MVIQARLSCIEIAFARFNFQVCPEWKIEFTHDFVEPVLIFLGRKV
ncbi:hypothetical protein BDSB_27550 [Burkholderia dolosa PC543]|nr:hypothetical protein BDSB_27550 [Burkholderia dolosa PC543]